MLTPGPEPHRSLRALQFVLDPDPCSANPPATVPYGSAAGPRYHGPVPSKQANGPFERKAGLGHSRGLTALAVGARQIWYDHGRKEWPARIEAAVQ